MVGVQWMTLDLGTARADPALAGRPGHVWVTAQIGWARVGGMACYLDERARQVRNWGMESEPTKSQLYDRQRRLAALR